ncbi:hypothetical protein [Aurantiacibacter rhizosphaerae]|uniref:Uncharacterized protein n=1 Tax=Aurantiacibacter rhizosphaerae TaxID=2691582 RepID=A0A844X9X3_9SPHN|nr:hypothetical protein [Aurantiacibacter rhizosphaerae]MWV26630.1 hypothetical protein [Aurantiacibacter rhizosphaerae]
MSIWSISIIAIGVVVIFLSIKVMRASAEQRGKYFLLIAALLMLSTTLLLLGQN